MAFKKYKLSESQLTQIARLCVQEQGCIAGIKAEASLMANQLETSQHRQKQYGTDGNGLYSWVRNGGWYYQAKHYMDDGSASKAQIEAVREVLCEGKRTLPQYVDEHDAINDIEYIKLHGEKVSKTNRANYKKGRTIIKNKMGSIYIFYCFPAEGCDPFGYTQEAYNYVMEHKDKTRAVDRLLATAEAEVGYLEKKSNKDLDSKTANAGDKNYTKYARDLFPDLQGMAWCDMFVDWVFWKCFGEKIARKMLGGFSADCDESARIYNDKNRWFKNPQVGDQIFFVKNGDDYYHTGIVYKVTPEKVYTIEGNTSAGEQVIPNGGAVCRKSYERSNTKIGGYGRPDYAAADGQEQEEVTKVWVKSQVPMLKKGMYGKAVEVWQTIVGVNPDGDFGSRTLDATVDFQTSHGLDGDGIVGQKTWMKGFEEL